ncbi:hypothetical protein PHYBLDRAFT_144083 [Phycomyces blakesleeanus NRRL 1555(-)]|uniref:Uncharacterized protein n=2 Tax=Phycomyces blakesleeanus TaxID=4837 RepID=A0A162UFA5_PHYB8|nr:hypothetical protein PHYBLDRAFT_144083 [Phycomyces blakesleeanus NRRL 1555(-)]OAD74713.1 hypothetical protein PHYBLDRAFT_144083 [Phycomyces blakesleeanus NRRL 1555(-)]|eukprot:XP_018292753.1 hypothetical protein PHYBLDRAFT_144083 [Phycomyces blakesleeanus NRRL 1555(-)]
MSSKHLITTTFTRPAVRVSRIVSQQSMRATSHMSDNDPKILEEEKNKTLNSKNKEWNEKLASVSEAAIKAEHSPDKPVKELQEETKKQLKDSHK